jgi:hypothetical protein
VDERRGVPPTAAEGETSGDAARRQIAGRVADAEVPGWAGGVMAVLRWGTLLVEITVMVLLGALAGGGVVGRGPARGAGPGRARGGSGAPPPGGGGAAPPARGGGGAAGARGGGGPAPSPGR